MNLDAAPTHRAIAARSYSNSRSRATPRPDHVSRRGASTVERRVHRAPSAQRSEHSLQARGDHAPRTTARGV